MLQALIQHYLDLNNRNKYQRQALDNTILIDSKKQDYKKFEIK